MRSKRGRIGRTRQQGGPPATRQAAGATRAPVAGLGRQHWLAILALLAVACAVTSNALGGEFVLDDESKIVGNMDIRRLDELPGKLVYPYQQNQFLERNDPSRPLVFLIYGLIYHRFGPNPVAFHAANALVHVGSALLVYLLTQAMLWYLTGARRVVAPLLAALFFTVTPIQVGTVIYAYALNDVLSSFLILLSLFAAVRVPDPGLASRAASLAAMVLALFTKQSAVVIPVLILAFDYFIICGMRASSLRPRLRRYGPYAAVVAVFLAYRFWYFGSLGDIEGRGNTHPALEYFLSQPAVILKYLFSSVIPRHLAIDHYLVPRDLGAGTKAMALVLLVLALAPLAWLWRRATPVSRYVLFAVCFYVVVLAPTSSFMPTVDLMVERRVYLANAGLFLLVVLGWDAAAQVGLFSGSASRVSVALVGVHLAMLAGVSIHRNQVYRTNEGVWVDVLRIYPASERALNNLGNVYLDQRRYDKAKACFEPLVARNPRDYIAQQNLGAIHEREDSPYRDEEHALAHFQAAVAANPDFAEGHYNLGRLYQKLAQARADASLIDRAVACYTRTVALNPSHVLAHNNLGLAYLHQGRRDDARRELETASRLDPACEPARANLKLLEAPPPGPAAATAIPSDQIPREMLIRLYEDAIRRDPNNAQIRQKYDELVGKTTQR